MPLRIAVAVNGRVGRQASRALARLRERTRHLGVRHTRGDADDARRIESLLAETGPDVLVAAGGDGTAALATRVLLESKRIETTALAFLPLGTGNNAARSFGLAALRDGDAALDLALDAICGEARRAVDVGLLDGRPFLGSVAIGMDADVLSLRNRIRRRLGEKASGYGLYLGGALANLALGAHGGRAELVLDGVSETRVVYNLAVVNAPVYAGPLRFDAENDGAGGRLHLHAVASGLEYLSEYPRAWLRHLRVLHGRPVRRSPLLRFAREIDVAFDAPVAAEMDGEELGSRARFRFSVLPRALRVCLPPSRPAASAATGRSR